eukprot:7118874-Prymnesium_polylepis.2
MGEGRHSGRRPVARWARAQRVPSAAERGRPCWLSGRPLWARAAGERAGSGWRPWMAGPAPLAPTLPRALPRA